MPTLFRRVRPLLFLALATLVLWAGCRERSGRLRLVFSADTHGFLEDCGCGSSPQGGLARRAALLGRLRADGGPPVLLIDGGNLHHVTQDEAHSRAAAVVVQSMGAMAYDLAVLGPRDAALERQAAKRLLDGAPFPWLAGAYRDARRLLGLDTLWVGLAGGLAVGVLDMADPTWPPNRLPASRADTTLLARARRLRPLVDVLVVVAAVDPRQPEPLARSLDGLADLLLVTGSTTAGAVRVGGVLVASLGDRGRQLGLLEVEVERGRARRQEWRLLAVDSTLVEDSGVAELVGRFRAREESEEWGRRERRRLVQLRRLGIPEADRPGARALAWYVGAETCRPCHQPEYEAWRGSLHATTYAVLLREGRADEPAAQARAVTGWLEKRGWLSHEDTPQLSSVQCEACHGRGSAHVASRGELRTEFREEPGSGCADCHTPPPPAVDPHGLAARP